MDRKKNPFEKMHKICSERRISTDLLWIFPQGGGGTGENFDRDARVIFLGLKFTKTSFFWVSLSCRHFFGFEKIAVIFFGFIENLRHFLGY